MEFLRGLDGKRIKHIGIEAQTSNPSNQKPLASLLIKTHELIPLKAQTQYKSNATNMISWTLQ